MYKVIVLLLMVAMLLSACATVKKSDISADDTHEEKHEDTTGASVNSEVTVTEKATEAEETTNTPETETDDEPETQTPEETKVRVEEIKLDKYEVNVEVGGTDMPLVTMLPSDATDQTEDWSSSDTSVATVNYYGKITGVAPGECTVTVKSKDNPSVSATVTVKVSASKGVTYINGILIANKTYALPSNYAPGVDATAQSALNEMIAGAAKEGINLYVISSYRSYSTQVTLYNNYVARDGVAAADRYSARAGHSEHQTGLAFDLNSLEQSWGETKEGKWLAANCHKYGFIIRYPQGKEGVTGYMYEPWHVRYLGKEVANNVYQSGKCLEEYLGITSKYAN